MLFNLLLFMRRLSFLLSFQALLLHGFGQTDSMRYAGIAESRSITEAGAPIYNGRVHVNYHPSIQGSAYYQSVDWQKGTLVYENVLYRDISVKYDVVTDEVIVLHLNGYTGVTLFTPRIQSLSFNGSHIVYLNPPNGSSLKAGLYEELTSGKITLYAKRSRLLNQTIVSNAMERKFVDQHKYAVSKDGQLYPITSEKDIMALVDDRKKEITAWRKTTTINFKRDKERAFSSVVAFYNQQGN
jgi:hypothetical protein